MAEGFKAGDTYSYVSVTQGHLVTWTRNAVGAWTADDDRNAVATDDDVRQALYEQAIEAFKAGR